MKRRIYHGSTMEIPKPLLSKGKSNNDYGRGFYCTEDLEMAREWACRGNMHPGFVNAYDLEMEGLSVLDLSSQEYSVLNWMAVLLANRTFDLDADIALEVREYLVENFMPPIHGADVVVGYRADDSYFSYADSFVNNALSLRKLNEALRLGRLGLQTTLRSDRAFGNLTYRGAEGVMWDEYHSRHAARDAAARAEWRNVVKPAAGAADDVYAIDIIRRRMRHGDASLQ